MTHHCGYGKGSGDYKKEMAYRNAVSRKKSFRKEIEDEEKECRWCDRPKSAHAHRDASAMRGETAREHVFEPNTGIPVETEKRVLLCSKCGRADESWTAYCAACGRVPHYSAVKTEESKPSGQLRRKIKGVYDGEFEVCVGANTYASEDTLAITKIFAGGEKRWIHLPRSQVKKLIEDFENGKRGNEV